MYRFGVIYDNAVGFNMLINKRLQMFRHWTKHRMWFNGVLSSLRAISLLKRIGSGQNGFQMREYGGFNRNSGEAITSDSAQLQPSLAHQAELPKSYYNAPHGVVEWYYGPHAIQLLNFLCLTTTLESIQIHFYSPSARDKERCFLASSEWHASRIPGCFRGLWTLWKCM